MGRPRRSSQNNNPANKQQRPSQQQNSQQIVQVTGQFRGPLPPPDVLERYNQVAPDAASRIIDMAEQESSHRRNLEQIIVIMSTKKQEQDKSAL